MKLTFLMVLLGFNISTSWTQAVTIGFEQEMYSVYEVFDVEVCVNLSSGELAAERMVNVTLSTDDVLGSGQTLLSMDYEPLSVNLTFSDNISNICVNVTTIFNADTNAMPFNVNLTTMEPTTAVILSPSATTINILDVVVPRITTPPMDQESIIPGSDVSFTVVAEGGALSYQWSRDGIEIEGATQATLTLVGVTIEDEGTYSCFIYNRAGNTTTNDVSLTVLRQPNVTLEVPTGTVLNQEITFTCTAAVNATITLTVMDSEGANLTLTEVDSTGKSRSVNVTVMTTGQHTVTCVVDNGLVEMATAQFYGITIEVADVTAGITATAVFSCDVTGAGGVDVCYFWTQTRNGVFPEERFPAVIYEDRIIGLRTPTLMIPNLSGLEQDFDYTCTVSIGGMRIGSGTGTLTSPGPVILIGPNDQELQAGERLVLSCSGQNNEDATMPLRVNWFFTSFDRQFPQRLYTIDDPQVNEIRLPNNITTNNTFVIDPVMATDGGVYGCQISNRYGILPIEQNATVNVLFTPQIRFMANPNPVEVTDNTILRCIVTAEPLANFSEIVRITSDGEEVVPVANVSNSMDERTFEVSYTFKRVRFPQDDRVMFECRSINANGPEAEHITIVVQARPSEIDHSTVTAELTSLENVNITWFIPSANNAHIQSYNLIFCVPLETGCADGTLRNINHTIGEKELIILDGNRLRYTLTQLLIDREYEVRIRASNSVGQQMSPMFGGGLRFNSASPDDGQVVNVASVSSTNTIILTWNLPPLALATTSFNVSFDVTYSSVSDPLSIMSVAVEYNASRLEQGVSVDLMEADSLSHSFEITAWYNSLNLLSSQATLTGVRTLTNDATLLGPEAVVSGDVSPNDVLTISWPPPMNTNFLVSYRVSYTTSPVRSRRQTSPVEVPAGMTSTTLPFTPFTDFTVDVDAVYAPPPDGTRVVINLLPPTTFTTPQRASSPPLGVTAANESVIKIRLIWEVPTSPNGIITGYRIIGSRTGQQNFGGTVGANTLTFLSPALAPNTEYTFQVAAINGAGDGMLSITIVVRTNFSVVQPVISSTAVGDSGNPSFTITTGHFSDAYGRVGILKVVVVRGSRVEPRDIPDSSLAPAGVSQFNYYVAHADVATQLAEQRSATTIIIGNNVMTTDGSGTRFTNLPPEVGEDYYVFIRLYSTIDVSLFVDSELTDVLRLTEDGSLNSREITAWALIAILVVLLIVSLTINGMQALWAYRRSNKLNDPSPDCALAMDSNSCYGASNVRQTEAQEAVHVYETVNSAT